MEFCSNWLRLIKLCENVTLFWSCGPDCNLRFEIHCLDHIIFFKFQLYREVKKTSLYLFGIRVFRNPCFQNLTNSNKIVYGDKA